MDTVWNITVGGQVIASVVAASRSEAAALTDEQAERGQLGCMDAGYHLVPSVPAAVADAEELAATASAMHDIACRELIEARAAMTAASRRYVEADRAWDDAGAASAAAQANLGAARKAAGIVLTADGYQPA